MSYDDMGYSIQRYTPDGDKIDMRKQQIDKQKARINELSSQLLELKAQQLHELELRMRSKAVQDAWEQYQIAIKLAQ